MDTAFAIGGLWSVVIGCCLWLLFVSCWLIRVDMRLALVEDEVEDLTDDEESRSDPLTAAQPAPESPWVKVCDRLPEGQNRLVLVKFSDMLGETVNTMWSMKIADNINSGCITHWMEIPEVPCDK